MASETWSRFEESLPFTRLFSRERLHWNDRRVAQRDIGIREHRRHLIIRQAQARHPRLEEWPDHFWPDKILAQPVRLKLAAKPLQVRSDVSTVVPQAMTTRTSSLSIQRA